ncbi:MAG: hypothetical protein EXS30_09170 [Pedosphaera sp.]|nr:hypothetical protein [Pedosphaera sp.]
MLGPKFAGAADFAARSYQVKHWTTDNGLPQSTITCLRQTRDGYLWIGTRRALARFDGHTFKVFTDELTFSTPGDMDCRELAEDSEVRLWVRSGDGIIAFEHGRFQRYSTHMGPLQGLIHEMRGSTRGGLWLSRVGRIWFSVPGGLLCWVSGTWSSYPTRPDWNEGSIAQLAQEDVAGGLWFIPYGGPVIRFHQGEFTTFGETEEVSDRDIRCAWADREGNVWIGTGGGGLDTFEPASSVPFSPPTPRATRTKSIPWPRALMAGCGSGWIPASCSNSSSNSPPTAMPGRVSAAASTRTSLPC